MLGSLVAGGEAAPGGQPPGGRCACCVRPSPTAWAKQHPHARTDEVIPRPVCVGSAFEELVGLLGPARGKNSPMGTGPWAGRPHRTEKQTELGLRLHLLPAAVLLLLLFLRKLPASFKDYYLRHVSTRKKEEKFYMRNTHRNPA